MIRTEKPDLAVIASPTHLISQAAAVDFYGKAYEYYAEDKAPYVPIEETLYGMELIRQCHENAAEGCQ